MKNIAPASSQRVLSILCITQALAILLTESIAPFWPLLLAQYQGGELALLMVYWLPLTLGMLSAPLWGVAADRFGQRLMIIRSLIALASIQLLLANATELWHVLTLRALQGVFAGSIAAISGYWLLFIKHSNQRGKQGLGWLQSATALGALAGPTLAGIWLATYSAQAMFLLNSMLGFALLLLAFFLPSQAPQYPPLGASSSANNASAKTAETSTSMVIALLLACVLCITAAKKISAPILADYVLSAGLAQSHIGWLYALPALSTFLTAPWISKLQKFDDYSWLALVAMISAVLMLAHSQVEQLWSISMVRLGLGCCMAALLPQLKYFVRQQYALVGQSMGHFTMAVKVGAMLGSGLSISALALVAAYLGFIFAAIVMLVACCVCLIIRLIEQKQCANSHTL